MPFSLLGLRFSMLSSCRLCLCCLLASPSGRLHHQIGFQHAKVPQLGDFRILQDQNLYNF